MHCLKFRLIADLNRYKVEGDLHSSKFSFSATTFPICGLKSVKSNQINAELTTCSDTFTATTFEFNHY